MLKLLIVEDEMLVRLGLKSTVDWNSLGFEIVGEAEDGEIALQMARELRPDLVMTDISMPRMDGLELIKALKKELPSAKVMVLSCHKDYEYVREAMQNYGALDYLLKIKLKPDELREVMLRAKETIEKEKKKTGEYLDLQWQMNSNAYDLKGKLFNDLLEIGCPIPVDVLDKIKLMKVNLEGCLCIPVCILLDNYYELYNTKNRQSGMRLLQFSILNICAEVIEGNGCKGEFFHRRDGEFGIVLLFNGLDENEAELKASNICKQLQSNYKMFLNVSVSFGIGKVFEVIEGFCQAYQTAWDAVCERFYRGRGGIYKSNESVFYSNKLFFDSGKERALRMVLEERKKTEAWKIINEILNSTEREKINPYYKVMEELKEILNIFSSYIRNYSSNFKELRDENGRDPYESLTCCETLQDVGDWFDEFIERYFNFLNSLSSSKYSREVNRALEYITAHYKEDIGLQNMADYLHLNESYFSFVFKKETGQNFTDYLNLLRIEKAKELLRISEMTVSDVWCKVGYSSLSYFSRVFKQYTLIGPGEYKRSIQK